MCDIYGNGRTCMNDNDVYLVLQLQTQTQIAINEFLSVVTTTPSNHDFGQILQIKRIANPQTEFDEKKKLCTHKREPLIGLPFLCFVLTMIGKI